MLVFCLHKKKKQTKKKKNDLGRNFSMAWYFA
jgi:hypothetical protein